MKHSIEYRHSIEYEYCMNYRYSMKYRHSILEKVFWIRIWLLASSLNFS